MTLTPFCTSLTSYQKLHKWHNCICMLYTEQDNYPGITVCLCATLRQNMSAICTNNESIEFAMKRCGYTQLRDHQRQILERLAAGQDFILCAPTGSGKSLVYEVTPFLFHHLKAQEECIHPLCRWCDHRLQTCVHERHKRCLSCRHVRGWGCYRMNSGDGPKIYTWRP